MFPARPWEDGREGEVSGEMVGRGERGGGRAGWRGGDQVDRVRLPVFPARPWEDGREGEVSRETGGGEGGGEAVRERAGTVGREKGNDRRFRAENSQRKSTISSRLQRGR